MWGLASLLSNIANWGGKFLSPLFFVVKKYYLIYAVIISSVIGAIGVVYSFITSVFNTLQSAIENIPTPSELPLGDTGNVIIDCVEFGNSIFPIQESFVFISTLVSVKIVMSIVRSISSLASFVPFVK